MQRLFFVVVLAVAAIAGWANLSLTVGGCSPGGAGDAGPDAGDGDATVVEDIEISTTTLSADHTVGTTDCPQVIGTIQVTNVGDGSRTVSIAAGSNVLVSPASVTLNPNGTDTFELSFDCGTTTSFERTLTLTVTDEAGTEVGTETITVNMNISGG
jgi:hypothetical protein